MKRFHCNQFLPLTLLCLLSLGFGMQGRSQETKYKSGSSQTHPLMSVFIGESLIAGMSFLAARPNWYTDKVMAGTYLASSGVAFGYTAQELFRKKDSQFSTPNNWRNITTTSLLGIGFMGLSYYNFFGAKNHSNNQRFWTNFVLLNTSYGLAIGLPALFFNSQNKDIGYRPPPRFRIGLTASGLGMVYSLH